MKKYALYLPQFHAFEENDKWWGDGYTEWVNVKSAKQLYKWHDQPVVPKDGYYDLSDVSTMERQYKAARANGIDAFAVYHYWSNGHQLMQKPINNLLDSESVEFKYYLTWANHNFYDKISYLEKKLLWKQQYDLKYIASHVEVLVKNFDDRRYEKLDGAPIFAIYDPRSIPNFASFITKYRDEFSKRGYENVHIRIAIKDHLDIKFAREHDKHIDSTYEYQPYLNGHKSSIKAKLYEFKVKVNREIIKRPTLINARKISREINKTSKLIPEKPYGFGVYVGWDTTPRWGVRGIIHKNFNQSCIDTQMERIIKLKDNHDFVVYTAWNEWGEGAVLENIIANETYAV